MTRAYCRTIDAGIEHGMQDITEIEDRAPVYRSGRQRVYVWHRFACGCFHAIEQTGADA